MTFYDRHRCKTWYIGIQRYSMQYMFTFKIHKNKFYYFTF